MKTFIPLQKKKMIRLLTFFSFLILLVSCKAETKDKNITNEKISEEKKELTIAEKIAQAHGIDHWKNVNEINFTFNVDRGESHFERIWSWQPKGDYVISTINKDSITMYTRNIEEVKKANPKIMDIDKGFINDKFWLLVPFQLVWDAGTTISKPTKEAAPISKTEMNKITLTYADQGGYTPGDAYDIFYSEDYLIKEWVFRRGNSEEPTMTTSFENYEDFKGIKIAKSHKTAEGNFHLYFSNITIK